MGFPQHSHPTYLLRPLRGKRTPVRQRERRHMRNDIACDGAEIDQSGDIQCDRMQTSDPKQLINETVHPCNVFPEHGNLAIAR